MSPTIEPEGGTRAVRVLPEGSIDKTFDYLVPAALAHEVAVGTMVRVSLHGRRVGAWVTEVDVDPPAGVALKAIAKVTGHGPAAELIELAGWAAWRWAGRRAQFLRTASPPTAVRSLPTTGPPHITVPAATAGPDHDLISDALGCQRGVLRLPPGADRYPLVLAAATAGGNALILCPTVAEAKALAGRLRRSGLAVACVAAERPGASAGAEWAKAAAGATVIGARAGAWAPVRDLARIVVLDEHEEVYQGDQAPTWHARDVAIERARRAGVPCLLVSPCPTLEALAWGEVVAPSRGSERRGWPALEVVDRRGDDPTTGGLYSDRLVDLIRGEGRILCIVNRVGRARLIACTNCGELGRCDVCRGAVEQHDGERLVCRRCGAERPIVCGECGSVRFKNLRAGVARVREELEALVGEPVDAVTAADSAAAPPSSRVVVGTTALLHRSVSAGAVAFLDIDQELSAPRYRANEQALGLLALGARLVRGRLDHGRLLVQTRQPDHVVLQAALHADPGRVGEEDLMLRRALRLPPVAAMAVVSGAGAPALMAAFGRPPGVSVEGPADGRWRLRSDTHGPLCDALAATPRPADRVRIEVDPLGL